jgi:flagellar hook-associated protein 3 FlgL
MTRVTDRYLSSLYVNDIKRNKELTIKFGNEVSTGLKVSEPGDSTRASTIANFRTTTERLDGYKNTLASVESFLNFQESTINEASNLLVRAKEVATQGANESIGVQQRQTLAQEIFQLRDQFVRLANSTWLGKSVWNGAIENQEPFVQQTYATPASGGASQRWVFNNQIGSTSLRQVGVGDGVSLTVNSAGNSVFEQGITALERLGRSLAGYATNPASGTPDGTGGPRTFPADLNVQTADINAASDLLDSARKNNLEIERISLGARQGRLDTVKALIDLSKTNAKETLSSLQDADVAESASNLAQAQNALESSYILSNRFLRLTILDYL